MNRGVLWYIDFADWSVISPCTETIQMCVNFLVGTCSFTQYVLVQFYGKSEFCKNSGFSLSGSQILSWFWGNILGQEILNLHDPHIQYLLYCKIIPAVQYNGNTLKCCNHDSNSILMDMVHIYQCKLFTTLIIV